MCNENENSNKKTNSCESLEWGIINLIWGFGEGFHKRWWMSGSWKISWCLLVRERKFSGQDCRYGQSSCLGNSKLSSVFWVWNMRGAKKREGFLLDKLQRERGMFGRKDGPGQGYLPGTVLAGTRIWIFGESVLAAIETCFSGCNDALRYRIWVPGFYHLGQKSHVLLWNITGFSWWLRW